MQNLEKVILLLVSGQGILLSFALLSSVISKKYSNFFLGLITTVVTLEVLNIWAMRVSYHGSENAMPFWLIESYLILPPALWLFFRSATERDFKPRPYAFFLFIPAFVEIVVELFTFCSNRFFATDYRLLENRFWFLFTEMAPIIATIAVLSLFAKRIYNLEVRVKRPPHATKTFLRVPRLSVFFSVVSLLTLFWMLLAVFHLQVFVFIETILLLFLFALGYLGYFRPSFFDIRKLSRKPAKMEGHLQYDDQKELGRLRQLFEEEKIYTRQRLTLKQVASRLDLPQRYISGLVNSHYDVGFTAYVNSFRVAEVLKRIKDPEEHNKTLLGIALESGFNSKSSFNHIFKETTGKNPSYFLKKRDM